MGVQDADFIQRVLECNKAMNERKPPPRQRNQRQPVREELKIKDGWDEMTKEHRQEWMKAKPSVKEKILAQRQAKSSGPPTKNHQLPTGKRVVYRVVADEDDDNGYFSDQTANSEATYDFNASSALVYDATDDGNSDGESVLEGQELTVNAAAAAAATKSKSTPPGILKVRGNGRRRKKQIFKSSEIPAGAVSKMMANQQMRLIDQNDNVVSYWTGHQASMTVMDYSRCDSLMTDPIDAPPPIDLHYKVHLMH